ncbi:MAG: hypothetical protein IPH12_12535 [Saprospirales bacterium]|nr:hypothetical protein [Saprospirales bacterium]MBK8921191.1 hypothetical protein [Saprospirales bacterium]
MKQLTYQSTNLQAKNWLACIKASTASASIFSAFVFICFLFLSSGLRAQSACNCVGCPAGFTGADICGELPDYYGPYYVKVYLYFVVPPNTSGAFEDPLSERSEEIWQNWRAAFSPHRIFFIPGFGVCDPSGNYDTISK